MCCHAAPSALVRPQPSFNLEVTPSFMDRRWDGSPAPPFVQLSGDSVAAWERAPSGGASPCRAVLCCAAKGLWGAGTSTDERGCAMWAATRYGSQPVPLAARLAVAPGRSCCSVPNLSVSRANRPPSTPLCSPSRRPCAAGPSSPSLTARFGQHLRGCGPARGSHRGPPAPHLRYPVAAATSQLRLGARPGVSKRRAAGSPYWAVRHRSPGPAPPFHGPRHLGLIRKRQPTPAAFPAAIIPAPS